VARSARRCFSAVLVRRVLWCVGLCFAASHGGKLLGDKLLRYSYMASAAIFCYFAVYVILSGYNEFIGPGAIEQLHAL